jgi:hypothetical protein
MGHTIRVEKCPDKDTADFRAGALSGLGFKVQIIKDEIVVWTSEVTPDRKTHDQVLWPNESWVVLGVK